jgi:drug/metabolite transporter (DMT)-like permease
MMTLTLGLLTLSCYFLWRRKAHWGWAAVMAALLIGIIIFVRDVDFAANLGVQL